MSEQGINRLAVSQLRPGDPLDAVRQAWGSHWAPPPRKSEGYLWGSAVGVDCVVRLDVGNVVGSVSLYGRFPPKYALEGVSLGMNLADLQRVRPELLLTKPDAQEADDRGIDEYSGSLANGWSMAARLRNGKVIGVDLDRPDAVYPSASQWVAAPPGRYPPPEATAGAPFADPNFKLVVMQDLLERGLLDLGEPEDLAMHLRGRIVDLEKDGHEFMADCHDYLVRYPLGPRHLEGVRSICLDGGLDIYRYMFYHWDGEGDEFDVRSMAGIEQCTGLEGFDITAMCTLLDLAPLARLSKLATVGLACGPHANEQSLLQIPSLREFSCFDTTLQDARIIPALRARGVAVKVYE